MEPRVTRASSGAEGSSLKEQPVTGPALTGPGCVPGLRVLLLLPLALPRSTLSLILQTRTSRLW